MANGVQSCEQELTVPRICMEVRNVQTNKKHYLNLLLIADEQDDIIDRYLERGDMYVIMDNGVKGV